MRQKQPERYTTLIIYILRPIVVSDSQNNNTPALAPAPVPEPEPEPAPTKDEEIEEYKGQKICRRCGHICCSGCGVGNLMNDELGAEDGSFVYP